MEVTLCPPVHLQTGLRNTLTFFLFVFKSTAEPSGSKALLLLGQVPVPFIPL
jgi:hypothetical protein